MKPGEKQEFSRVMAACMEVYQSPMSKEAMAVWWGLLDSYSLDEVRNALAAHMKDPQRGQFPPKPADVIAKIPSGHPAPEEAWAMVARAIGSEGATVVLTEPMRAAFFAAEELAGDKVAARMAFLDVYKREVATAGRPIWSAILGHDQHGREAVLQEAVRLNRLPAAHVQQFLPMPAPKVDVAKMLEAAK